MRIADIGHHKENVSAGISSDAEPQCILSYACLTTGAGVNNPEALMAVCPLSCGVCSLECNDTRPECPGWQKLGGMQPVIEEAWEAGAPQ